MADIYIQRAELTGFRPPTIEEQKTVWKLSKESLLDDIQNIKGLVRYFKIASVVLTAASVYKALTTETHTDEILMMCLFVLFALIMWKLCSINLSHLQTAEKNLENGLFQVLDVDSDYFTLSASGKGLVRIRDHQGRLVLDSFLVDKTLAKRYYGSYKLPMLYVFEPKGNFYIVCYTAEGI